MKKFNKKIISMLVLVFVFGFVGIMSTYAATTPALGAADDYGILSSSYVNTSASTTVTGAVGFTTSPAVAPLGTHLYYGSGAPYSTAGTDQGTALTNLNGQSCTTITGPLDATVIGTNPAGTFPPGCYTMAGALIITASTSITLDLTATGGVGSTWIFKSTGGGLTTGADSFVTLANGASSCDVFWAPIGAATIGAYTGALPNTAKKFIGTIIDAAGINLGDNSFLTGRALAFGGTVTTGTNVTIDNSACAVTPANLTVVKVVINNSGRNKVISDFPLFINGSSVTSGLPKTLVAGTYTVTETTDANYAQTFSSNCPGGVISLASGDTKTCTITNDDIAPVSSGTSGGYYPSKVAPILDLVKIPSPLALPAGPGPVTYTYTLKNIGTVTAYNISLADDSCSPVAITASPNVNNGLGVNETWTYTCTSTLSQTTTNTATATGYANGISTTDIAKATVVVGASIVPPLIHVTKVPSRLSLSIGGGIITYTEKVTNPGVVALSNVTLTDDKCLKSSYVSGDLNGDSKLDTSETWTFMCQANLLKTTTNTASVEGTANGLIARDFAIVTVVVSSVPGLPKTGYPSAIDIEKQTKVISANLVKGNHGDDVTTLQEFLISQDKGPAARALAAVGSTKNFGQLTKAALAEWQKAVGVMPTLGNFGSKTRAYIMANY